MRGICIAEAVERTGLTERQLRLRKSRGAIRWRMRGRYLELHEEDVAALEVASWRGGPVLQTGLADGGVLQTARTDGTDGTDGAAGEKRG